MQTHSQQVDMFTLATALLLSSSSVPCGVCCCVELGARLFSEVCFPLLHGGSNLRTKDGSISFHLVLSCAAVFHGVTIFSSSFSVSNIALKRLGCRRPSVLFCSARHHSWLRQPSMRPVSRSFLAVCPHNLQTCVRAMVDQRCVGLAARCSLACRNDR